VKFVKDFLPGMAVFSLALLVAGHKTWSSPNDAGVELFDGRDFTGWTFCMKDDADPMKTWSVTNGVIHCTGRPIGYMRTKQAYSNYVVTVVWRFVKVTPKADNTGVLVHIQAPDRVWPVCIQNQGKSGRQGDLFLMEGAGAKEHKGLNKNTPVPMRGPPNENPVGDWNTNMTVCAGTEVKAIINGKWENELTQCTISSGFVGIQSEGGDIEIRRIYLAPLS
jgi:3-keto-disaccharide hydrolase